MVSKETLGSIEKIIEEGGTSLQSKTSLKNIDEEADKHAMRIVGALQEGEIETLLKLVRERRSKLALSTGITDQVLGVCKQVLAFGAAGLAIGLAFLDKARSLSVTAQKVLAVIGIFYGELAIVSLVVLIVYILQARFRYPFLYFERIGNTWPFFYYASISDDVPRREIQSSDATLKGARLYATDFLKFLGRCLSESDKEEARNELQQYFLLLAYQGYVNQFSLRLANLFAYGFVGAFITGVVMALMIMIGGL